jgi:hypothetical protein
MAPVGGTQPDPAMAKLAPVLESFFTDYLMT